MGEIKKSLAVILILTAAIFLVQYGSSFAAESSNSFYEETTIKDITEKTSETVSIIKETTTVPRPVYTIMLDAENDKKTKYKLLCREGDTVNIPYYSLYKDGFYFLGWSQVKGSDKISFSGGESITPDGDINYYGVWKKADFCRGDADFNGYISSSDARYLLRTSVNLEECGKCLLEFCDIDKDGRISSYDARFVLCQSVGCVKGGNEFFKDPNVNYVGLSDKDYIIYEKNGLTYIDGVLIANKSYDLPASYNPGGLTSECENAFNRMQADANRAGCSIWIGSGYRSYALQRNIYGRYVNRDGSKSADTYSARPGHSEHQTGLAIDLNDISYGFSDTAAGRWIAENCWKYGFIIRYPKGKSNITGYCYEPWHIRYVGRNNAEKIYKSGLCIEEYYGIKSEYGR